MHVGSWKGQVTGSCNTFSITQVVGKVWGEAPPRAGSTCQAPWVQETLAARAAAGDDSLVPTQLARAGGSTVCKHTAITAPGHAVPALQQEKQEQTICGRGNFRCWGQLEDEDAHSYPLGSPQPAVLVVYNLMQTTVSTLRHDLFREM